MVSGQVALTRIAQQRDDGASLMLRAHLLRQLQHADEVGAGGRADFAAQQG